MMKVLRTLSSILVVVGTVIVAYIYRDLLIAKVKFSFGSTPSSAMVSVDGKLLGKTPLITKLAFGVHVVEFKKEGYVDVSRGFRVGDLHRPGDEINIEMTPIKPLASTRSTVSIKEEKVSQVVTPLPIPTNLSREIAEIRSMILANPKDAVTVIALQERMRLQGDEIKGLREEVRDLREQGKWFMTGLVAVIVGIVGVAATIFQTLFKRDR